MNEIKEIFNMCDVMFVNADIDYDELTSMDITEDITEKFFEDYKNTRIVNSFLFNFSKLQDKITDWDNLREIRNILAHEYPLDIDERVENIQLALDGYQNLKKIYNRLKDRVDV
jgi:uncharacterized protein with HEPN domain